MTLKIKHLTWLLFIIAMISLSYTLLFMDVRGLGILLPTIISAVTVGAIYDKNPNTVIFSTNREYQ